MPKKKDLTLGRLVGEKELGYLGYRSQNMPHRWPKPKETSGNYTSHFAHCVAETGYFGFHKVNLNLNSGVSITGFANMVIADS